MAAAYPARRASSISSGAVTEARTEIGPQASRRIFLHCSVKVHGRPPPRAISVTYPGGWAQESTWAEVIPKVVAAMEKLHKVLSKRAIAAKGAS